MATRQPVKWATIEKTCSGYRDTFVYIFRRYEGMLTDEKDARGRTVKVTQASFARHAGIPEQTFRQWVKATKQVVQAEDRERLDRATKKQQQADLGAAEYEEAKQKALTAAADPEADDVERRLADAYTRAEALGLMVIEGDHGLWLMDAETHETGGALGGSRSVVGIIDILEGIEAERGLAPEPEPHEPQYVEFTKDEMDAGVWRFVEDLDHITEELLDDPKIVGEFDEEQIRKLEEAALKLVDAIEKQKARLGMLGDAEDD